MNGDKTKAYFTSQVILALYEQTKNWVLLFIFQYVHLCWMNLVYIFTSFIYAGMFGLKGGHISPKLSTALGLDEMITLPQAV